MFLAHLAGRVAPESLERALSAEFVAADPRAELVLRDGGRVLSPALARSRGVLRFAYRVALGTEADAARRERDATVSRAAQAAASSLLSFPSREGALALERARFALLQASEEKRARIDAFFASRPGRSARP